MEVLTDVLGSPHRVFELYIYINKRKGSNADSTKDKDEVAHCISYFLVYIEGFLFK